MPVVLNGLATNTISTSGLGRVLGFTLKILKTIQPLTDFVKTIIHHRSVPYTPTNGNEKITAVCAQHSISYEKTFWLGNSLKNVTLIHYLYPEGSLLSVNQDQEVPFDSVITGDKLPFC